MKTKLSGLWVRVMSIDPALTMLIAFQIGFWITRYVRTHTAKSLIVKDVAVHHFIWGIGLLVFLLIIECCTDNKKLRRPLIWLFGILLGIIFDEFSMWLHLKPDDGLSMKGFWIMTVGLSIMTALRFIFKQLRRSEIGREELLPWSRKHTGE